MDEVYQQANLGEAGYLVEQWPDQAQYLTGYSKTTGYQTYPGLGWIVIVRQSMDEALAPVRHVQKYVLLLGTLAGVIGGIVAWWLAGQVAKSVLAIAHAAVRVSAGDRTTYIPIFSGRDELATLLQAIAALFGNLDHQNQRLLGFNDQLEQQVQQRTHQLKITNIKLQQEIEDRKQAQSKLEKVNQELQRLTLIDGLTRIANRRRFDEYLDQEWGRGV